MARGAPFIHRISPARVPIQVAPAGESKPVRFIARDGDGDELKFTDPSAFVEWALGRTGITVASD